MTEEERQERIRLFAKGVEEIANIVSKWVADVAKALGNIDWGTVFEMTQPENKRVVHLAYHAKKKRVRKKNLNRLEKYKKRR